MAVEPAVRPHRIELSLSPGTMYEEGPAAEDILPGMLIERVPGTGKGEDGADFDRHDVRPHSVADTRGEMFFAVEDALQGRTIDDSYLADPAGDDSLQGDVVMYRVALPGDKLYLLVDGNVSYDDGDALTSKGDGTLKKASGGYPGDESVIAVATETLDLTGEADAHIRCRIVS